MATYLRRGILSLLMSLAASSFCIGASFSAAYASMSCISRQDVSTEKDTRLSTMAGFAKLAKTSGGAGRPLYIVTDNRDIIQFADGMLSLREAIFCAKKQNGADITFSPSFAGKTIHLSSPLRLGSNITIDGGPEGVSVESAGAGSLFYLRGVENVVLLRLRLSHHSSRSEIKYSGDCITISHGADRIWIAYNEIRDCHDGLVDVTQNGAVRPMRVTVSFNRFSDHDKAILIAGDAPPEEECRPGNDLGSRVQVTLQGNLFWNTGQRHPRVSGDAFAHVVDSLIAFQPQDRPGGDRGGAYGALAGEKGRLLVERTMFHPLDTSRPYRLVAMLPDTQDIGPERCAFAVRKSHGSGAHETSAALLPENPPYRILNTLPSGGELEQVDKMLRARTGIAGFLRGATK